MAVIRPFRALRYNEEVIADINLKFSPLFDVVSKEELEKLYQIPNNSIHLSVPRSMDDAVAKLHHWREEKILRQDALPAIYIYYQEFFLYGEPQKYVRKGFVSMVRIHDTENAGDVVLHEDTISHSVSDRMELLERTRLNVSPTHGLYSDPDFSLEKLMDEYMEHPRYQYLDYQGVNNKLAIVQHKADIDRFIAAMRERKIYLADGHHRLASSQALQKKMGNLPGDPMVNYHLMYLTNLHSDDLRILPIHRVLRTPGHPQTAKGLLRRFDPWFTIQDVSKSKQPLYEEVRRKKNTFGLVVGGNQYLISLRPETDPVRDNPLALPEAVKKLEYSVLHYFVFDRIFGIPYERQTFSQQIEYQKDYSTAVREANESHEAVAFIVGGLTMDDMMAVCNTGALMPQKSTYFYPKVICGLIFASIDENDNNTPFDACFAVTTPQSPASGPGITI
ncbi:MAG: DUF1015 domain-containing protein [Bacteroidia bacterium]|nr:DUF1015 domain-containing protein [Bacteroidia bacterium]